MPNQDYTIKELLQTDACTHCRICAEVCPAVSASQEGDLSPVCRINSLRQIVKSRAGLLQRLLRRKGLSREEWDLFSNNVFRCTLCGSCQEVCPVGIRLRDLWLSLRQDMVHSGYYTKRIETIRDNLNETRNVFAEDNEERAEWVDDLREAPDHGYVRDKADVVYFTGCVSAFFPLAQRIPMALAEILDTAGADFTLLGEDEWCCGFPLLGAGLKDLFKEFADHNSEAVRKKRAKKIIFACPSCYQMWREYYPREFEIAHVSEFLVQLIKENRIPLRELPLTVTYHDPCDLGRGARVFDEPREIIRSVPGVRLTELPLSRENCQCCGGGGNLEMTDPGLSSEISKRKIKDIVSTGAQGVVTSCQQCLRTMTTYAKRNKIPVEVMDITQLLHRALRR